MVCTPLPPMAKWISSGEPPLAWPLALKIACRSEPAPPSLVFETVKIDRSTRGSRACALQSSIRCFWQALRSRARRQCPRIHDQARGKRS